ncbi:MAG: hypothetical protein EHM12_08005 [Dehalococcoidia bacterium]|nr:MAG: hypothetical protein EHM12_08005 [Dehalococcoidia bacterium]
MHRLEIPLLNYVTEFAGTWGEMKPNEVLYACKLLQYVADGILNPIAFKKLMADKFLNRKNSFVKPSIYADEIPEYWVNEAKIAETMNFFFDIKTEKNKNGEDIEKYDIKQLPVNNLIPFIDIGYERLYGPADMLGDISLLEFRDALVCCGDYSKGNKDAILRLAAILYRPKKRFIWFKKILGKYNGYARIKYLPYKSIENKKLLDRIKKKEGFSFYCFLWFNGVTNYLFSKPIILDGHEYNFGRVLKGNNNDNDNYSGGESLGFTGVMYALSETGIFGDIEKTGEANIMDVFVSLYRGYLQEKEMQRAMKKTV